MAYDTEIWNKYLQGSNWLNDKKDQFKGSSRIRNNELLYEINPKVSRKNECIRNPIRLI